MDSSSDYSSDDDVDLNIGDGLFSNILNNLSSNIVNNINVDTWNSMIEGFLEMLNNNYDDSGKLLTVVKTVNSIMSKPGINNEILSKILCSAWKRLAENPNRDLYEVLILKYNVYTNRKEIVIPPETIPLGLFATSDLQDDLITRHIEVILYKEAKRLFNNNQYNSEPFLDFLNGVLQDEREKRSVLCMEFIKTLVRRASENHLQKSVFCSEKLLLMMINSLSHTFENSNTYCVFAGNCFEIIQLLQDMDGLPSLPSRMPINTIFSVLEWIISVSSSKMGIFERYNYIRDFNVLHILAALCNYLQGDHITKKNAMLYALTILSKNALLLKFIICNDVAIQSLLLNMYSQIIAIIPPLKENHVERYFSTFFEYLQCMIMLIKDPELMNPLLKVFTAIANTSLHTILIRSHLFIYLHYLNTNSDINPILMENSSFRAGLSTLLSKCGEPQMNLDSIQDVIASRGQSILSFLQEDNIEVLKKTGPQVVEDFQALLNGLTILDVYRSRTIFQLINTILLVFNKEGNSDVLRLKLQMISLACFADSGKGTIGAHALMDYINILLFQSCPVMNEHALTSRSTTILYDAEIKVAIKVFISNREGEAYDMSLSIPGVFDRIYFDSLLYEILSHKRKYDFIKDTYKHLALLGYDKVSGFNCYYGDERFEIDFSFYKTVYNLMKKSNAELTLTNVFDTTFSFDVVVLKKEDIDLPISVRMLNRTVDVMPIENMEELSQAPSFFFLNEISGFEQRKILMQEKGLSPQCVLLLEFTHFLIQLNTNLQQFSTSFLFNEDSLYNGITIHAMEDALFCNAPLSSSLHSLLQNSCIVLGQLIPDWLQYILQFTPQLFTFTDRISYMYSFAFDSFLSYTKLFERREWQSTHFIEMPQNVRIDVNRDNVVSDAVYITAAPHTMNNLQIKFADEDGIGSGPTKEFITMFSSQIQRRDMHLWSELDQEPYSFETTLRMMNYPTRGPEVGVVSEERDDSISGAVLRCYKCACFNMFTCPHHDCLLSLDRKEGYLFCRECDYTQSLAGMHCENCGKSSDAFQRYWFTFKRSEWKEIVDWFQDPSKSQCFFGTVLCSICNAVSICNIQNTEEEALQGTINRRFHSHGKSVTYQCILRSMITRSIVERCSKCLKYSKPCKMIDNKSSVDYSEIKYMQPRYGLFPAYFFEDSPVFEDKKSIFFTFGVLIGYCIQYGVTFDLELNPLLMKYIMEDVPAIRSIDGATLLLSLFSREQYRYFAPLFEMMKLIQNGEHTNVESLLLDCSLPSNPSINLLPKHVESAETDLSEENFPLWLSRYVQVLIGDGIRPAINLIRRGIEESISLKYFRLFSLKECSLLLFGEKMEWTKEFLKSSINFSQGYINDSEFAEMFIDTILSFNREEQEKLLLFITGQRRIDMQHCINKEVVFTVVEKTNSTEDSLPTAAICIQQLHMPHYKTKEIMREKLLQAISEAYMSLYLL